VKRAAEIPKNSWINMAISEDIYRNSKNENRKTRKNAIFAILVGVYLVVTFLEINL
jgi:hypothetical protein